MENFAENLNLGKRVLPSGWQLLAVPAIFDGLP